MQDNPIHPIASRIQEIIEKNHVPYERFEHKPVRTSQEAAAIRPEYTIADGAKALIVHADAPSTKNILIMLVVPGNMRFHKQKIASLGYTHIHFASEDEVIHITGGVLPGGVPPWGFLFSLRTIVDEHISQKDIIVFNAGDRRVSIAMRAQDYINLVHPDIIADITDSV